MISIKLNPDRLKQKRGDYYIGTPDALGDHTLQARAQEFKRRMSGTMRPITPDEIFRIAKMSAYYTSRKYDGEFVLVAYDGKEIISVNPRGTIRKGLPCMAETAALLKKAGIKSALLAAEIYVKPEGKSSRVYQTSKALRSPATVADLEKIRLAFFDVVEYDDAVPTTVADVYKLLDQWFGKAGGLAKPVEYQVVDDLKRVRELFEIWSIKEGGEGICTRHEAGWYKIKERHNLDVAVIGFSEGIDDRKGLLHDLLVAVIRDDGTYHEFARVGGGFTDDDRKRIPSELKKRIVPSEYVAVNNDYVAYEMIEPGPVIEISCLDLISENTKGDPINKMVLEWDGEKFVPLARLPLASTISPLFIRMRDDKEANVGDVNIRQLESLMDLQLADKSARDEIAKPSKLLERVVYTKMMKGKQMVRKLLLWKTNKEGANYPAYVVYLTDFSPNRQNPLERDIRVAGTEKAARDWFVRLAEENFISGWEKAG